MLKKILLGLILFTSTALAQVDVDYMRSGLYSPNFRDPVANVAALPTLNNNLGDLRVELTGFGIYIWDGSAWQSATAGGVGIFLPLAGGTMTGAINLSGNAVNPLEPVTLQQFNLGLQGLVPLGEVYAATIAADGNQALTGPVTADGQVVPNGQRVLLQFQTSPIENGVWVVDTGGAWSRPANFAAGAGCFGAYVSVVNGPTHGSTFRIQIGNPCVVDTNNQTWNFQAGTAISADGTTIVDNASVFSVANGGILNVHVGAAAAIDVTKLQVLTNDSWVITDGAGYLTTVGPLASDLAVITDPSGLPDVSITTATELSYLSGATSNIQTQIDAISAGLPSYPLAYNLGGTGTNTIFAPGSVIFAGGASFDENNTDFFWDDLNGRLGILSASDPKAALTIGAFPVLGTLYPTADTKGIMLSSSSVGTPTQMILENTVGNGNAAGAAIMLSTRKAAETQNSERLGAIRFMGSPSVGALQRDGAYIQATASANWNATSAPASLGLFTTPISSTTALERLRVFSGGQVAVGSTPTSAFGTFNVYPLSTGSFGVYVRGLAGQTGDLYQGTNNVGTVLFRVESDGDVRAPALSAEGTAGAGFLSLSAQSSNPSAPVTGSIAFSNVNNQFTITDANSGFAHVLNMATTTNNRTYTFQDANQIIGNVPAVSGAGVVFTSGTTLTSGDLDLAGDVTGTLPIANGGTGSTSIPSGTVTSNGTVLSSRFDSTYISTNPQSSTSITHASVTQLTSASLAAGTYRFSGVIVFQSAATGTGIGLRMGAGSSTISSLYSKWRVSQGGNGVNKDYVYDQIDATTNITSASVNVANTDAVATVDGIMTVSVGGTVAIQFRSETGTSVTIRPGSFITIEAI